MTAETVVRRVDGIPFTHLGDELLAVDAEAGYVYALNETGGTLWNLLQTPLAVRQLCDRIRETYDVDEPTCRTAVTEALEALQKAGLVEVV
jgi:hypothetical protein